MVRDFENGDARVDYAERWDLRGRKLTNVLVHDSAVNFELETGDSLVYSRSGGEHDGALLLFNPNDGARRRV